MRTLTVTLLILLGCSQHKGIHVEEARVPGEVAKAKYLEVASRLPAFLDQGFVVSRNGAAPEGRGDSLLFSGLALYALGCEDGRPIADALAKMLKDKDGGAYRHPDLQDQEVSLDGLLGLYRGINKRITACGEMDLWRPLMKNHRARMAASLPAEFNMVADVLLFKMDLADAPDAKRIDALALEVSTWAAAVKAFKGACYRVHLGLIALQTLEEMNEPVSDQERGRFADATAGTRIATVDQYCGRPGLDRFLSNFAYNEWQYAFQRCPVWEKPDGNGLEHPAVDYLVGYADLYGAQK